MKEKVKKIQTLFEKLVKSGRVDKNNPSNDSNGESGKENLSIGQKLYYEMQSYFSDLIDRRSTPKSIVFHMGYIVWIEPSDYLSIRDELVVIVPDIIDGFYDIIRERSNEFVRCIPPSTEWLFQITPSDRAPNASMNGGQDDFKEIKKGNFIISSTFHSISRAWSNVQQQPNVVLSYRPQNSNTIKDLDVNKELLLGIEALQGAIWVKFDYAKAGLSANRDDIYSSQGYAKLKFSTDGKNATYIVKDKSFYVSGSADQRKQYSVLVLPDESVIIGHLSFRYRELDDHFEVAAYGHTVLNDRVLKISTIEEPIWYKVSAEASFLLGDGFGITFTQNKLS